MLKQLLRQLLGDRTSERLLARARSAFEASAFDEAERLCAACAERAPHLVDLHRLRGLIALRRGEPARAVPHLRLAAALNEAEPASHAALGEALQGSGAHDTAAIHFARALELVPAGDARRPGLVLSLAVSLYELGRFAEAEPLLRALLALDAGHLQALYLLASIRFHDGDAAEARGLTQRYAAARPGAGPRLRRALMMPIILQSNEEIDELRRRCDRELDSLLEERLAPMRKPEIEVGLAPFYVAYHGRESRELLAKFGRVCRAHYPARTELTRRPRPQGKRVRVGFVSTFFYRHSISRTTLGLIKDLPREHFEVQVFAVAPKADDMAEEIRRAADHYLALRCDVDEARAAIEAAAPDALFYADLGMHPVTTFLSLWRLAPLQMMTWGHPVTSGIDTVDYYVSSRTLEAPGSERRYTEKLIRLPGYFMPRYRRPTLGMPPRPRGELGMPDDKHVYYCPQSLFKLHPEFDRALSGILHMDPLAEIVLLNSREAWMERLRVRLTRALGPQAARVRFLPAMPHDDFLRCLGAADVVLDPFHFGGNNSSCEALALGVPVVTLPASGLPGRFTLGLYRELGLDACIARSEPEFVELAVRLGTQPDYRSSISAQITERCERLFERPDAALALGEELLRIIQSQAR